MRVRACMYAAASANRKRTWTNLKIFRKQMSMFSAPTTCNDDARRNVALHVVVVVARRVTHGTVRQRRPFNSRDLGQPAALWRVGCMPQHAARCTSVARCMRVCSMSSITGCMHACMQPVR